MAFKKNYYPSERGSCYEKKGQQSSKSATRVRQCTMSKNNIGRINFQHEDRDMDLEMLAFIEGEKDFCYEKSSQIISEGLTVKTTQLKKRYQIQEQCDISNLYAKRQIAMH